MYYREKLKFTYNGSPFGFAKQQLRRTGNAIGFALLGYLLISFAFPFFSQLAAFFASGGTIWDVGLFLPPVINQLIITLTYTMSMLLPFWVLSVSGGIPVFKLFSAPKGGKGFVAACIALSLGAAVIGNTASEILSEITAVFGYVPYYSSQQLGAGLGADILMILTVTVGAAVLEEFAFRGVILTMLRPYGDGFAVLTSAFIFALCHPSAAQLAPAFISGLAFGFITIVTGSITTSVLAHFIYNSLAIGFSEIVLLLPYEWGALASLVFVIILLGTGILGTVIISRGENSFKLGTDSSGPRAAEKVTALATSIPLIVACCIFALLSLSSFVPTYL